MGEEMADEALRLTKPIAGGDIKIVGHDINSKGF